MIKVDEFFKHGGGRVRSPGLARMIREARGGMNVRAAAAEMGVSPTTLTKLERGQDTTFRTIMKAEAWVRRMAPVPERERRKRFEVKCSPEAVMLASEAHAEQRKETEKC